MIQKIKTIEDVKTFFKQLLAEDLNFHPDTPFDEYINMNSRQDTYTSREVIIRTQLLAQCFKLCEEINVDIYELSIEIFGPNFPSEA